MKFFVVLAALAALVLAAAQCGLAPTEVPVGSGTTVMVMEPWARSSPMVAGNGAVYLKLMNEGSSDDALLSATTDVAEVVELHETKIGENDVMQMSPVARIEVPAGGSVSLEPGGKHIMLLGLKQELAAGQKIDLTLQFEKAGAVVVEAEVRGGDAMEGMGHSQ